MPNITVQHVLFLFFVCFALLAVHAYQLDRLHMRLKDLEEHNIGDLKDTYER